MKVLQGNILLLRFNLVNNGVLLFNKGHEFFEIGVYGRAAFFQEAEIYERPGGVFIDDNLVLHEKFQDFDLMNFLKGLDAVFQADDFGHLHGVGIWVYAGLRRRRCRIVVG